MNFAYGVIVIVGVLVAVSIGFIAMDPNFIIEPRVVEEKPGPCTLEWVPICGIDGVTYGNSCMLNAADVKLAHKGECSVDAPLVKPRVEPTVNEISVHPSMTVTPQVSQVPVSSGMVVVPGTYTVSTPQGSGTPGCEDTNSCYLPYEITISAGDKVTWINNDSAAHTVTSGNVPDGTDGVFDSGLFMAGTTFEFTFDKAATYDYFCLVHPWMTGKVIVNEVKDMIISEPESVSIPTMEEPTSESEMMDTTIVSIPIGVAIPGCEDTNSCYLPYEITISAGDKVTWINNDSAVHTVTSGNASAGFTGVFDSGLFMAGTTFEFTFDKAATYDYFCLVHPWMTGKVTVK